MLLLLPLRPTPGIPLPFLLAASVAMGVRDRDRWWPSRRMMPRWTRSRGGDASLTRICSPMPKSGFSGKSHETCRCGWILAGGGCSESMLRSGGAEVGGSGDGSGGASYDLDVRPAPLGGPTGSRTRGSRTLPVIVEARAVLCGPFKGEAAAAESRDGDVGGRPRFGPAALSATALGAEQRQARGQSC